MSKNQKEEKSKTECFSPLKSLPVEFFFLGGGVGFKNNFKAFQFHYLYYAVFNLIIFAVYSIRLQHEKLLLLLAIGWRSVRVHRLHGDVKQVSIETLTECFFFVEVGHIATRATRKVRNTV